MNFGKKIKKLRKEKRLSKKKLGNELNVSKQTVSKWESNKSIPDIETQEKIAEFFYVKTDYLINEKDEELSKKKRKMKKKILIILGIILLIYIISIIYKFIALATFYNKANSFFEKNYWMSLNAEHHNLIRNEHYYSNTDITRDHNSYLKKVYLSRNEKEFSHPDIIIYVNKDKDMYYELDGAGDDLHGDGVRDYFVKNIKNFESFYSENDIKEITLPDVEGLFVLLNPFNTVSYINKTIQSFSLENGALAKKTIYFNDLGLIEGYSEKSNNSESTVSYSYDFNPEHFTNNLSDPIINEEIASIIGYGSYNGIIYERIDDVTDEEYPTANAVSGIYILAIETSSPAENAGLQNGDIITAIDGTEIKTRNEFKELIDTKQVGDKINLTIYRSGENKNIELIVGEES